MAVKHSTRMKRLHLLRQAVALHIGQRGRPVKLNGESRSWDMYVWACNTSACAFGSYALTPYGKKYFKVVHDYLPGYPDDEPTRAYIRARRSAEQVTSVEPTLGDAALHFGIMEEEAEHIFMPEAYEEYEERIPPHVVARRIDGLIAKYERLYGQGND